MKPLPKPSEARVLMVGAGGLGAAAGLVLARSGVGAVTLVDNDRVEPSNLHRQLWFGTADLGAAKVERAAEQLCAEARARGYGLEVRTLSARMRPENVQQCVSEHDLVMEGADNYATKFLLADAGALLHVPVVSAGAVRWSGWALASAPGDGACLRCVFEDVPQCPAETCDVTGVVGPVVGVLGALQAALALRLLSGDPSSAGELWSYRGMRGELRRTRPQARAGCPLCSGRIQRIDPSCYGAPPCRVN